LRWLAWPLWASSQGGGIVAHHVGGEVLQWHRGGSVLTMTASRSGRGGVGHMTASCFVFLIAPIAELHDCSGCNNCKCCLIVKSVEGVEAVASGEDAAAIGRR